MRPKSPNAPGHWSSPRSEVCQWMEKAGRQKTCRGLGQGGTVAFDFGRVKMVNAVHSSRMPDESSGGFPVGFVVETADGNFYHAGDTALTMDMQLIAHWTRLRWAALPIGDHYTMGVDDAVRAAEFVGCNRILGIHYDTFPPLRIDHEDARRRFTAAGKELVLMGVAKVWTCNAAGFVDYGFSQRFPPRHPRRPRFCGRRSTICGARRGCGVRCAAHGRCSCRCGARATCATGSRRWTAARAAVTRMTANRVTFCWRCGGSTTGWLRWWASASPSGSSCSTPIGRIRRRCSSCRSRCYPSVFSSCDMPRRTSWRLITSPTRTSRRLPRRAEAMVEEVARRSRFRPRTIRATSGTRRGCPAAGSSGERAAAARQEAEEAMV